MKISCSMNPCARREGARCKGCHRAAGCMQRRFRLWAVAPAAARYMTRVRRPAPRPRRAATRWRCLQWRLRGAPAARPDGRVPRASDASRPEEPTKTPGCHARRRVVPGERLGGRTHSRSGRRGWRPKRAGTSSAQAPTAGADTTWLAGSPTSPRSPDLREKSRRGQRALLDDLGLFPACDRAKMRLERTVT